MAVVMACCSAAADIDYAALARECNAALADSDVAKYLGAHIMIEREVERLSTQVSVARKERDEALALATQTRKARAAAQLAALTGDSYLQAMAPYPQGDPERLEAQAAAAQERVKDGLVRATDLLRNVKAEIVADKARASRVPGKQ